MLVGILVCVVYVALLIGLQKASGVRYDQITDSADTMRKGVAIPVAVCTVLLVGFLRSDRASRRRARLRAAGDCRVAVGRPAVIALGIVLRLLRAPWSQVGARYVAWAFVGDRARRPLRGAPGARLPRRRRAADGSCPVGRRAGDLRGLRACCTAANILNGQDARTTAVQVVGTVLMGLALFACLAVSGTLWLPIVLHFLFDFSLVVQGQVNKADERQGKVETGLILLTYALAVPALFVARLRLGPRAGRRGRRARRAIPGRSPPARRRPGTPSPCA